MAKKVFSGKQMLRLELMQSALDYYRRFPDKFCEEVLEITLNLYQKVLMRAFFQKKYSMWVLSRGLGKSWLGALCLCIYCILYRNTLTGIIAPSFRQSKLVIEDKIIKDLMDRSPFLAGEISKVVLNMAESRIEFFNGSRIMAVPLGDGNKIRGYRFHILMVDEYAQVPKEILDLVVNPMMNVKRGYEVGKTEYDDELGNRLLITSSAYYKYNHLFAEFNNFVDMVAKGNEKYFVATLPYQVGIQVGLFDEDHIEKEKVRLTVDDFRMEYECIFPNISQDAWISPKDLEACTVLKHIEIKAIKGYRYVMGLDVARVEGGDNSVCHVVKLVPRKNCLERHLVYTVSMNGVKFEEQARTVRNVLKKFPVEKIFMDTQTIGKALADELAKEYFDVEEQIYYPPLIDENDEQAVRDIPNGIPLIYGITPSNENNHLMGLAVKKCTQKHYLKMYTLDAGDDKFKDKKDDDAEDEGLDMENARLFSSRLSLEEETQVLEAETTRREVLKIEARANGMYFKFILQGKKSRDDEGRKDRWSALGLALRGVEILEDKDKHDNDVICVGSVSRR